MTTNIINNSNQTDLPDKIVAGLKLIFDPEIPVNIYDLGLIYQVEINEDESVNIQMTLTSPGCPVAQTFPGMVEMEVKMVEGVTNASCEIVWDPPWTRECMSEAARLELGMFE